MNAFQSLFIIIMVKTVCSDLPVLLDLPSPSIPVSSCSLATIQNSTSSSININKAFVQISLYQSHNKVHRKECKACVHCYNFKVFSCPQKSVEMFFRICSN